MFRDRHYVPVLKGKQGEFGALEEMAPLHKSNLTPLIEVVSVPWDYEEERPSKTVEAHLEPVGKKLAKAWGKERPLFLDLEQLVETSAGGTHPLDFTLASTRASDVRCIPVTGINRSAEDWAAVANAATEDGEGVCIRLTPSEVAQAQFSNRLAALVNVLGVDRTAVDIVLDYQSISIDYQAILPVMMQASIAQLPSVDEWRTLTIAATAFPPDLSGIEAATVAFIPRVEWAVWNTLRNLPLARIPSFGDYGISNPVLNEMDPRLLRMSASIRYTTSTDWLILKGRNTRDHGFAQFHDLAADLIQRPEYSSRQFSAGDETIWQCGNRQCGPGNATTWREVGTNHHMTMVTSQIANLP